VDCAAPDRDGRRRRDHAGNREALEEFSAAEHLQSQLGIRHVMANQVTGWMVATRARLGMTCQADAALAARLRDGG
jgi:LuxR family transcriptional regulator, maltose regulon positive regulatory protein